MSGPAIPATEPRADAAQPGSAPAARGASRISQLRAATRGHWLAIAAVAIALVYLGTRLWFIGGFPYFSDEGLNAGFATLAAHSLNKLFVSMIIGHEPLFVWLAIPLIKLGFNPLHAVRLVSIFAGLLTVGVVAMIGRRLGGRATALVSAGLCVLMPFFLVHDGIGINEPLITLIMASALLVQLDLARRPRLVLGLLLGIILGAGILAKQNTQPAIALVPLSLLCLDWTPNGRRERVIMWLGAVAIAAIMIVGAELVLRSTHYYANYTAAQKVGEVNVRSLHSVTTDPFGVSFRHAWSVFQPALLGYVTVPLLLVAAAGAALAWLRDPRLTLILAAWSLVPLAVALEFTTVPYPRHVMYILPPAIVLMAFAIVQGASWLSGRLPAGRAILASGVAAALVVTPAVLFDGRVLTSPSTAHYPGLDEWQYVTGYPAGTVWPAVANTIRRLARGPQVIVLTPLGSPNILGVLLGSNPRYRIIWTIDPAAARAEFVLDEATRPDHGAEAIVARGHFVLVRQFRRPNHGSVVRLYRRGAT